MRTFVGPFVTCLSDLEHFLFYLEQFLFANIFRQKQKNHSKNHVVSDSMCKGGEISVLTSNKEIFSLPAEFNMALMKAATQSETLWNYDPNLAVDGDSNTCSFTPQSDVQRWWQVSTKRVTKGSQRVTKGHKGQ